jgi:subtilisin family serine protease
MKTLLTWLLAALAAVAACASAQAAAPHAIVVLDAPPAAQRIAEARQAGRPLDVDAIQAYRAQLTADQDAFLQRLAEHGIDVAPATLAIPEPDGGVLQLPLRYTLIHNAVAIDVDDAGLDAIRALPGVRAVHRDRYQRIRLAQSVDYIRAPQLYGAVHELTPYDRFDEGFEGQGIHIAIIDTGIDWSHEQFGADPAPPRYGTAPQSSQVAGNPKVVYYLSLMENLIDDHGHGTHVAATAAGYLGYAPGDDGLPLTADDLPLHGVAPQARLMGYKVCSGIGSASGTFGCLGSSIQLALEDAVSPVTLTGFAKPVADVINLSLGGPGDPDDFSSTGVDNAVLAGAIVVAAGGNDGPGQRTLDSPGMARRAIQVAAHNDPGVLPNSLEVLGGGHGKRVIHQAPDSNLGRPLAAPISAHYVFAGYADSPDQVPLTVLGNICLVERGSTLQAGDNGSGLFASKAANCEAKGALATLVYNDVPGEIGAGVLAPASRPVLTASRETGLLLQSLGYAPGGLSNHRIVLGLREPSLFAPGIAAFSSRGPVPGLGQVKPDLAAPGVDVLAATTAVGAPLLSMADPSRYTGASGTSMATPHVAGAAALLKQARPQWGADEVRAALMNSASNGRDALGRPLADGSDAAEILSQGAGLIDVAAAAALPALLGVAGDGLRQPALLASHSFGEVPVIDSRVRHSSEVEIELRDVSGQGGQYTLQLADNRDLDLPGVALRIADPALTLPDGGSARTRLALEIDGDLLRDTLRRQADGSARRIELQGYLLARRDGGNETLRMPFYLLPARSQPASASGAISQTIDGLLPAADAGLMLVDGLSYIDHPVEIDTATFRLDALLEFEHVAFGLPDSDLPDLDLFLLDPDGEIVASSTVAGGPESISHAIDRAGVWTLRVSGWANGPTAYRLTITRQLGGQAPELLPFDADAVADDGTPISFDDRLTLRWQRHGGELGYEIHRALDGGEFELLQQIDDGSVASVVLDDQPVGRLAFMLRALHPGQIGYYVSLPSNTEQVIVAPRYKRDITGRVETRVSNASQSSGVFQFDLALTNISSNQTFVPAIDLDVRKIQSASGGVHVLDADNGGSGTSPQDPARFSYSSLIGSDGAFTPGETSGARRLRFASPLGESFSFKVKVTGHVGHATGAASAEPTDADEAGDDDTLLQPTEFLLFTVNPLLRTVTVQLSIGVL